MTSVYFLLVIFLSAIFGRRKPILGSLIGCVLTLVFYFYSQDFQIIIFLVAILIGFSASFGSAFVFSIIASGLRGGNHNTGRSFYGGFGRGREGGIILSDETREKNRKR